ncbi:MAG: nucleotidyltransferase [Gammaproteobacteria bacterium]
MAIPEDQLTTWANQGATTMSADTYRSVETALARHTWPQSMSYEVYLQGSYANATNIRADSDIDVICEFTSQFDSNLTPIDKQQLGLIAGTYPVQRFNSEVLHALVAHFGRGSITRGNKSIKIGAQPGRLKADVIPCIKYCHYNGLKLEAEGVKFRGQSDELEYEAYPKAHRDNGANKNSPLRTNGWYKPTVRIFKNMRNRASDINVTFFTTKIPSYFVECLLFNVPDGQFGASYESTVIHAINFLHHSLQGPAAQNFTFQHGRWALFGDHRYQLTVSQARSFTSELIELWNGW